MASPLFDEVSAGTIEAFTKGLVSRTLFTATAALRILRTNKNIYRPWQGGTYYKVPFDLQPVPSGFYSPGTDTFGLQQTQTIDDMVFGPRFAEAEVVILKTVTDVYNVEPRRIVDILKEKYGNASNSIDSKVAAALYNHGQAAGTGVTNNRIKFMNGFAEALNDGVTPSWTGEFFPTYGGQTRNSALTGAVLNSFPFWGGNTDGSAAPVTLQVLNNGYHRCKQGKGEGKLIGGKPDYGFTSDFLYGRIAGLLFPMQRADSEIVEPKVGMTGFKFNNAVVIADSYSPGLQNAIYIQDQTVLPSITTSTFTVPAGATPNLGLTNFPANPTVVTVGETFWWTRSDTWRFSYPRSGAYSFRNRGLLEAIDGDIMADIIRAAMVLHVYIPSSNQQIFGFNG
jgi:hypothetical protein